MTQAIDELKAKVERSSEAAEEEQKVAVGLRNVANEAVLETEEATKIADEMQIQATDAAKVAEEVKIKEEGKRHECGSRAAMARAVSLETPGGVF